MNVSSKIRNSLTYLGTIYSRICYILIAIACISAVLVVARDAYEDWSKHREADRVEQEKNIINSRASVVGVMIWSAYKECVRIGINDFDRCSSYNGQLIQEKAAPLLAKSAVAAKDDYLNLCERHHPIRYCADLLNHSIQLSQNQDDRN